MLINCVLIVVGNFTVFRDVHSCDRLQGLLGPRENPIDSRVANEARKTATTVTQRLARRRHRQDHMQILGTFINEVLPDSVPVSGQEKEAAASELQQ
jgi:hypothetical protein